jgi:hypothetical protein
MKDMKSMKEAMKSMEATEKENVVGCGMVKQMPREIEATEKEGSGGSGIMKERNDVTEKSTGCGGEYRKFSELNWIITNTSRIGS